MKVKQNMNSESKCVYYAYPSSCFGGKDGGWIAARYKNALATDPMEHSFFNQKEDALKYAEKTWGNLVWDKFRHCD